MSYRSVFLILVHLLGIPPYLVGLELRNESKGQKVETTSLQLDEGNQTSALEGKPVEIKNVKKEKPDNIICICIYSPNITVFGIPKWIFIFSKAHQIRQNGCKTKYKGYSLFWTKILCASARFEIASVEKETLQQQSQSHQLTYPEDMDSSASSFSVLFRLD